MNKSASFAIRTNPIWRNRNSPKAIDIDLVLNSLPNAACLIDKSKDEIIFGNEHFHRLAQLPQKDLEEGLFQKVFEKLDFEDLRKAGTANGQLKTFSGELIPVQFTLAPIEKNEQFFILNIIKPANMPGMLTEEQNQVLEKLFSLKDFDHPGEFTNQLAEALKAITSLIGIETAALYRVKAEEPGFSRLAATGGYIQLPEFIPSMDIMRLTKNSHWTPGQPVRTEIHRTARLADFQSLVTLIIGNNTAVSGLLIVGSSQQRITDDQINALRFFANLLENLLRYYVLIQNLSQTNEYSEKIQSIQNQLFNSSQDGIILCTPDLIVKEINPTAENILGYTKAEVVSQSLGSVLIGPSSIGQAVESVCQGEPLASIGNIFLHRRNGQSFPCNIRIVPILNENVISGILTFLQDISEDEQNRLRAQQLEQRAFLGDFTAIFAHEVRNPINNISTGLQLLASLMNSDDPDQEIVNRMLGDCTRLNQLMESILAFSRPIEVKLDKVNLAQLVNRILDRWQPKFSRVNVQPFFQAADNIPNVIGDPRSLDQVFTNLISNAVEAMSKTGGTLAIKIAEGPPIGNKPQVEVTVSDNGPGIPDDVRDRIFEPFVTTNPRGNGLGLAITKRIVTSFHGSIGVNSFPGGTVFHICLPADDKEDQ